MVFLISSRSEQNAVAHQMRADGKQFLREDLHLIGVNRTPTELAIDKTGRVLAIQVGTASTGAERAGAGNRRTAFRGQQTRYSRISGTDLPVYAARAAEYQDHRATGRKTLRVAGLRYREIPMDDLWVRAAHEIDRTATVFVDCDSARVRKYLPGSSSGALPQVGTRSSVCREHADTGGHVGAEERPSPIDSLC